MYYIVQMIAAFFFIVGGFLVDGAYEEYRHGDVYVIPMAMISLFTGVFITVACQHDMLSRMRKALALSDSEVERLLDAEDGLWAKTEVIDVHTAELLKIAQEMKQTRVSELNSAGWLRLRQQISGSAINLVLADCATVWSVRKNEFRGLVHQAVLAKIESGEISPNKPNKNKYIDRLISWALEPAKDEASPSSAA